MRNGTFELLLSLLVVLALVALGVLGRADLASLGVDACASLSFAWELMLENLAYTCTYGRKNCLTDKIYGSGPLTLGKIVGPVAGKLSEGVVRC